MKLKLHAKSSATIASQYKLNIHKAMEFVLYENAEVAYSVI